MKINYLLITIAILIFACNDNKRDESSMEEEVVIEKPIKDYPDNIQKVLDAHGGINNWNSLNTLAFTIENEEGKEITTTDLKNRKSLIETDKFRIGFDGNEVWIDQDSMYFKNDPKFYHNLMFYFYAMPFVLADDGITYTNVKALNFEGKSYPGIKISYSDGVGASPEDEYVLYYNADNYHMEWLGYTVTFFSKEKSSDYHLIKYDEWQEINGLKLPKSMQWFNSENDSITDMRKERIFTDIKLTKDIMPDNIYSKPVKGV